jgi:hypothetical protein
MSRAKPEGVSRDDWLENLLTGIRANLICAAHGLGDHGKMLSDSIELAEAGLEAIREAGDRDQRPVESPSLTSDL